MVSKIQRPGDSQTKQVVFAWRDFIRVFGNTPNQCSSGLIVCLGACYRMGLVHNLFYCLCVWALLEGGTHRWGNFFSRRHQGEETVFFFFCFFAAVREFPQYQTDSMPPTSLQGTWRFPNHTFHTSGFFTHMCKHQISLHLYNYVSEKLGTVWIMQRKQ